MADVVGSTARSDKKAAFEDTSWMPPSRRTRSYAGFVPAHSRDVMFHPISKDKSSETVLLGPRSPSTASKATCPPWPPFPTCPDGTSTTDEEPASRAELSHEQQSILAQSGDVRKELAAAEKSVDKLSALSGMEKDGSSMQSTTVMIRNLPRINQSRLREELDACGFAEAYDFLYLPCGFDDGIAKGYAFINFRTAALATALSKAWKGTRRFGMASSQPALSISAAAIQGLDANVLQWHTPRMRRIRNPNLRPFVAPPFPSPPPEPPTQPANSAESGWWCAESSVDPNYRPMVCQAKANAKDCKVLTLALAIGNSLSFGSVARAEFHTLDVGQGIAGLTVAQSQWLLPAPVALGSRT